MSSVHQLRRLGDVRRDSAHLSVSLVAFLVSVGNYLRRSRPRVQIAKAAIASEYVTQSGAEEEDRGPPNIQFIVSVAAARPLRRLVAAPAAAVGRGWKPR